MKTWSFYHSQSGEFAPWHFSSSVHKVIGGEALTDDADLKINTPEGHRAIEGHFDPLSQRVDLETGAVVEYQPPAPSPDHEWEAVTRRWVLRADVAARQAKHAQALEQIAALEKNQLRASRELLLNPADREARARLTALDAQIIALRADLS
jgi:hypothetical protein